MVEGRTKEEGKNDSGWLRSVCMKNGRGGLTQKNIACRDAPLWGGRKESEGENAGSNATERKLVIDYHASYVILGIEQQQRKDKRIRKGRNGD